MLADDPVLPDWADGCVTHLVPGLIGVERLPSVAPASLVDASAVVLVVIDGLGWHQLQQFSSLAPTLSALEGGPITTVAPSTTSAALTSITTGSAPGEHGIVGYRVDVEGENLNCLSWRTPSGDARDRIVPESFQAVEPFFGERPVVVQNSPFQSTGFTRAHLRGTRQQNWRTLPTLPVEVRRAVAAGEPFVYAYYDGIDKIAHEFGFGEHYRAELTMVDRMIGGNKTPGSVFVRMSQWFVPLENRLLNRLTNFSGVEGHISPPSNQPLRQLAVPSYPRLRFRLPCLRTTSDDFLRTAGVLRAAYTFATAALRASPSLTIGSG